jgi:DHA1 family tetracycline resistance protein-like MFS transporter
MIPIFMKSKTFQKAFPILIVNFIGYVGFSLPLPLFPPMFLNPNLGFIPPEMPIFWRNVLLGLLLATYPLGQFFGCPVLGLLSDRYGRRPILMFSLLGIIPTYILSAISVEYELIPLLFISRFLCGLLEGNVAIAQAAIADLSSQGKEKEEYFGKVVAFASAGFIFGPLLGGKFSDSSIISWFNFSTPFWIAAILVLLAFFVVLVSFKETKKHEKILHLELQRTFISVFSGFRNQTLLPIFRANFFFFLGMIYFFSFIPVYLLKEFHFGAKQLGFYQAYLAIFVVSTPFCFKYFSPRWSSLKITTAGSFFFGLSLLICLIPLGVSALLVTLIFPSIFASIGFTYTAILISDRTSKENQGEMLGLNQSLQFLSEIIVGITGGILAGLLSQLPLIMGSLCCGICALILLFSRHALKG